MESEAIVIGAGVEGSAIAYQLVKRGLKKVVLMEQFDIVHGHGSSTGKSRITRRAYNTLFYVKMMEDAFKMWSDLEKENNSTLYKKTGIIVWGKKDYARVSETIKSLEESGVAYDVFSGEEANKRYPQLRIPPDFICVFEKDGGILLADKALAAFQDEFVKHGGTIQDNLKVTEIIPGQIVTVNTSSGTYQTKKLIIAAGSWTRAICRNLRMHLPFKAIKTEYYYFEVDDPIGFSSNLLPVFALYDDNVIYGIPAFEYPGLIKIGLHPIETSTTGNDCEKYEDSTLPTIIKFVESQFNGVTSNPRKTESCVYTNSVDNNPVIDKHPQHPNIVVAAGFSGHGFKLSPVIGKLVAELVMDDELSFDLTPFRQDRF